MAAAVIAFLAYAVAVSLVKNTRWEWSVVGHYLFWPTILQGLVTTLELTACAMAIGIGGGVLLAVMRLSPNPLVSGASWFYIWFFRGTPVVVQLLFWNFIGAVYPTFAIGIPLGPTFTHVSVGFITGFVAAVFALGFNEAAYMAEIVRAGIISIDEGQNEAAQSLGMTRIQTLRRIVLPQAMRVIIPPTGNETISMLKTSAIVSFIALTDLLYAGTIIYSANYQTIQLLVVASIWYLVVTSVLYVGQYYVERYYARGARAQRGTLADWWTNIIDIPVLRR